MDFRQLRYFLAVLDAGSFTAAARRLHVSQPALGYQVKQLEARCGAALLERHSRGVAVTPAGAVLAAHGRKIMSEVEAAEAALGALQAAPAGELSLGVTPTPGRALAPGLVAMSASGSGLTLTLREGLSDELARLVVEGGLDAALCYDPETVDRRRATPLYTEDLFLVGPPDVVGAGDEIAFAEVARLPLVLDGRFQAGRRLIEAAARAAGLGLDLVEAEAVTVKRELLVRHGRCSIVPLGLFYEEIRAGQLAARRVLRPASRARWCWRSAAARRAPGPGAGGRDRAAGARSHRRGRARLAAAGQPGSESRLMRLHRARHVCRTTGD